jgi:hypothetical protein
VNPLSLITIRCAFSTAPPYSAELPWKVSLESVAFEATPPNVRYLVAGSGRRRPGHSL